MLGFSRGRSRARARAGEFARLAAQAPCPPTGRERGGHHVLQAWLILYTRPVDKQARADYSQHGIAS